MAAGFRSLELSSHTENPTTVTATVVSWRTIEVFDGGREPKAKVELDFGDSIPRPFIERTLHPSSLVVWKALRSTGEIAVPQLLTAGDDAYMSDITHDGSTVYGKYRHMQHDEGRRPDPFNPDIDKQFVRLLKKQRKQVAARVDACARAAASVSILLDPNDPLELIIHPDGTYSGGILDFRDVRINEPPLYDPVPTNISRANKFMERLDLLRQALQ